MMTPKCNINSPRASCSVREWLVAARLRAAIERQILDRLNSEPCRMWRAGTKAIAVPSSISTDEYTPREYITWLEVEPS